MYESISKNDELENEMTLDMSYFINLILVITNDDMIYNFSFLRYYFCV